MSEETRILHVSDTHLGKRMYGSDLRRDDFADAFEAVVRLAVEEDVDGVLHTGDLFDDPNPSLLTINRTADILRLLTEADIPLYAIVGNHERKIDDQWIDLMKRFELVHRLDSTPTVVGNFALYGFDAIRKPRWSTTDFTLERPPEENLTTVLCMHELFKPLVPEVRGAEYEVGEVFDRLNFIPDAMALGDFHSPVERTIQGCRVFYPGSTEYTSFRETQPRTVYMLSAGPEKGSFDITPRHVSEAPGNSPRGFISEELVLKEGDGLSKVRAKIEAVKEKTENNTLEDKVVVLTITGSNSSISTNDIKGAVEEEKVAVSKIRDMRTSEQFGVDIDLESLEKSIQDISSMLDSAENSVDTSRDVEEIIEVTRNEDVPKSHLREKTREIFSEGSRGDSQ